MNYAIIKVINGNYFIHAEGITNLDSAKTQFHGLCQALWNASDVTTATVKIVDEQLDTVEDYKEFIRHTQAQPTEEQSMLRRLLQAICIHEWTKTEKEPHEDYWDYSGYHVGVFKCKCSLCGKVKNRKYIKHTGLIQPTEE